MIIKNQVYVCSNYATSELQKILDCHAKAGYKLVSTEMAKNRYDVDVMYLFFAGEFDENKTLSS